MHSRRPLIKTLAILTGAIAGTNCGLAVAHSDVPDLSRAYTRADLDRFITAFGASRSSANFNAEYDFNNDGIINGADHSVLLTSIRRSSAGDTSVPPPPSTNPPKKNKRNRNAAPLTSTSGANPTPPPAPPAPPQDPPPSNPSETGGGTGGGEPESPPPPGGQIPGATFNASVDPDYQLTLTDLLTGRKIISPNNSRLWEPEESPRKPAQRPTITVTNKGDGFDVTYNFHNTTTQHRTLGRIILGGIRFNQSITTRDFFYDGKTQTVAHNNAPYYDGGGFYPEQYYSPVFVLQDTPYTMGVSFHYDVLKYKHNLFLRLECPGGVYRQGGPNWSIRCALNPENSYSEQGELAPGEQRTYVMSVRVLKDKPEQWIRTLAPYRDFFRSMMGPVDYVRDPRPIRGITTSQLTALSQENPYGFVSPYGGPNAALVRPDRYGWGPHIQEWRSDINNGWRRFMVWTPSGLFRSNISLNYPFQFTSQWRRMAPVMDSLPQLRQFAADNNAELGLWWGRSAQVMRQWDGSSWEYFDPDRSGHVAEAMEEIALAKQAGAECIGLDSFTMMQVWKSAPWLDKMKRELPGAKFVVEPRTCDILHNKAAMFVLATTANAQHHWEYSNPHYLADFLNPGHEIWAFIDPTHIREDLGRAVTNDDMHAACVRYANMGYVPIEHERYAPDASMNAAKSWLTSVPVDLQLPEN